MTHNETARHAADLVLRAGSVTRRDASSEAVFDKAAQDLRIPLSSQAIYWRPRHMESSPLLAQIPFLFWLMESIRPTSVVQIGTADGVVYLSLCQAIERLNLHASCLGLELREGQLHEGLRQQHDAQYTDFSILLRDALEAGIHYVHDTIDLLVLHDALDDAGMDRLVDEWLPLLSDRAVILICEPGQILLNERLRQALDSKPGQSVITGPVSLGGSRLDVILHGNNQPERLQALASLRQGHPAYLAARMVFNRLGQGLEEMQRARDVQKQRDLALSSLQEKEREIDARRLELDNLKKGLQDFEAAQTAAREERAALQKEAARLELVLSDKNQESENLHHQVRSLQLRLEKSEIAYNAALAKVEALEAHKIKRAQAAPVAEKPAEAQKANEEYARLKTEAESLRLVRDKELAAAKEEAQQRLDDIAVLTEQFNRELQERNAAIDRMRKNMAVNLENEIAREVGRVVSALFSEANKGMWRRGVSTADHVRLLVENRIVDPDWYRTYHADVAASGMDPALHYLMYGAAEGRPARKVK
ncbi:hypothetical protein ACT6QG_00585 [Xanthobacter sp. TB0136]|uniref:hypothetical protein n=1 Tax=Xanthobacter sp. TB0136 TaxID=3459177 RepID=UPI004039F114